VLFKRVLLPIVIITAAVFVFVALKQTQPEKEAKPKVEKVWRVNTLEAYPQTLSPQVLVYGRVETPQQSALKSALSADVKSVLVLEGDTVKAGQVLIELDDTDANLLLAQRQADLAEITAAIDSEQQRYKRDSSLLAQEKGLLKLAENAVLRIKKLEKTNLMTQASLDDATADKQRQMAVLKKLQFDIAEHSARLAQIQARKKRAEALLQQATVDLSRTKITAPFDGRVSELNVSQGERIRVGDSILSVYDTSQLEVRAQIPSRYIDRILNMMSQKQDLHAVTKSEQHYQLTLDRLSGMVKLDSGGVDGLFRFNEAKQLPILGSFVEMTLSLTPEEHVFAIPANALYGLDHIYIIKEGYLKSVDISRVGEFKNDSNEKLLLIRSESLQPGDSIVKTQLPNAITGLRVEALSE